MRYPNLKNGSYKVQIIYFIMVIEFNVAEESSRTHVFEPCFIILAMYMKHAAFNDTCIGDTMVLCSLRDLQLG